MSLLWFVLKLTLSFPRALIINIQDKAQISFSNALKNKHRAPHESAVLEPSFEWSRLVVSYTNTQAQV